MSKCCYSGTMVTIWKECFLILNPHTQLTASIITVVSHSDNSFVGCQKMENNFSKIVKFLVIKPLNLVNFKLIEKW
jgi:hypothetical protein